MDPPDSHRGSSPRVRFPRHRAWGKDIPVQVINEVYVSGREAVTKQKRAGVELGGLVALAGTLPWSDPARTSGVGTASQNWPLPGARR